ncbi:MAG: glycine oxidase ThiO [Nocardioidaceae bacterium]
MGKSDAEVVVIGQGVIGAIAAWRAAEAGLRVTCLDPEPAGGATFAAAGMIAPVTEVEFGERELLPINLASAAVWPEFAAALEDCCGRTIGLARCGTLAVAFDADDACQLARLRDLQRAWGLEVVELTAAEARDREPLLGPRVAAASWAPADHQVDPRQLARALGAALALRGVMTVRSPAVTLLTDPSGTVVGAVDAAGTEHRGDLVVLAAGQDSPALLDRFDDVAAPVRPVKGQILRLDATDVSWLRGARVVRGLVQQRPVYVVGRANGEMIVGATSEELPDDRRSTVGGVFGLLRDARAVLPGLDEAPLVECTARARPATPDNLPIFGPAAPQGLILATGHYRHGVLLAALTARGFDDLFAGRPLDPVWGPTDPQRFDVRTRT